MSKRSERLNELIKREISKIFLRDVEFPIDALVTVTRAEVSDDLRDANVWISVLPESKLKAVNKILYHQIFHIQQKINKTLKMRPLPKLKFVEEEETKEADKIEELLGKIKTE